VPNKFLFIYNTELFLTRMSVEIRRSNNNKHPQNKKVFILQPQNKSRKMLFVKITHLNSVRIKAKTQGPESESHKEMEDERCNIDYKVERIPGVNWWACAWTNEQLHISASN